MTGISMCLFVELCANNEPLFLFLIKLSEFCTVTALLTFAWNVPYSQRFLFHSRIALFLLIFKKNVNINTLHYININNKNYPYLSLLSIWFWWLIILLNVSIALVLELCCVFCLFAYLKVSIQNVKMYDILHYVWLYYYFKYIYMVI